MYDDITATMGTFKLRSDQHTVTTHPFTNANDNYCSEIDEQDDDDDGNFSNSEFYEDNDDFEQQLQRQDITMGH